jgi:hypothetical protein
LKVISTATNKSSVLYCCVKAFSTSAVAEIASTNPNILPNFLPILRMMFGAVNRCGAVVLLLLGLVVSFGEAIIEVVDSGKEYASRPDKSIGIQFHYGLEYPARLQRIPGNEHLCYDPSFPENTQNWNISVVPDDGLPGTLLVLSCMEIT